MDPERIAKWAKVVGAVAVPVLVALGGLGCGTALGPRGALRDHESVQTALLDYQRATLDYRQTCEEKTLTRHGIETVLIDSMSCARLADALDAQSEQIGKMIELVDGRTTKTGSWCDQKLGWLKPVRLVCGN